MINRPSASGGETDRHKLTEHAYKTQDKLRTRIRTHPQTGPFADWVLDQIAWRGDEWVIDVGCGAGLYAAPAREVQAAIDQAGAYRVGKKTGVFVCRTAE